MTTPKRSVLVLVLCLAAFLAPAGVAFALWSTTATGTVVVTTSEPTAAPTNFVCTDMDSDGDDDSEADFSWTAVAGATTYRIYELDGGTWDLRRGNINGASTSNLSKDDGDGSNDDVQVLAVTAVSPLGGESERSNQIEVDYDDSRSCGPPDLSAAQVGPCGTATLSWSTVTTANSYELSWRPGTSGTFTTLSPAVTATSATVTQAQLGGNEVVQVRVRAVNAVGTSDWSNTRAVDFRPSNCDPTGIPSGVVWDNDDSDCGEAALDWSSASNATGYRVYRRDGTAPNFTYALLAEVTSSQATISQGSPPTGITVVVTAYNLGGESGYSAAVALTFEPCPPTSFRCASMNATTNVATLTWTVASGNTYRVYQRVSSSSHTLLLDSVTSVPATLAQGSLPNGSLTLVVRAVDAAGVESANSNQDTLDFNSAGSCN